MTEWRLAKSLKTLIDQVNAKYPHRSKNWDGTVGDLAHQERASDHNPDDTGMVCAADITHDPTHGMNADQLAEHLRLSKDPRIKYIIYNRRIFSSAVRPWEWRHYSGSSPHDHHVHVSVMRDKADEAQPWRI